MKLHNANNCIHAAVIRILISCEVPPTMATEYGDVFDFDLDFLHQNNDVTVVSRLEKQRKAVLVAKKKTIATDSLIKKYYEKKDVLDQIEKNLIESKEECKQVCIDYRNALQKVTLLEESEQKLRIANQELEERCAFSDNRYTALQSHTNQLQLLVKDYVTKFEAMEIENQLQKSSAKEYEKKVSSLERQKDVMSQHVLLLKDVVLGKKKLDNKVLDVVKKYKSKLADAADVSASDSEAYDSCVEADDAPDSWKVEAFTDADTQETTKLEPCQTELKPAVKSTLKHLEEKIERTENTDLQKQHTVDLDHDSDGSNEILLSVDTGRGSSLAFSDSEKGFLSPDNFCENILPKSVTVSNDSTIPIHSDSATSHEALPSIQTKATTSIFDAPSASELMENPGTTQENFKRYEIEETTVSSTLNSINTASDTCTFVIDSPTDDDEDKEELPVNFEEEPYDGFLKPPARTPKPQNPSKSETECLKFNSINTNLLSDENSNDFEVSTILSKMSLHYSLITPLPQSPTSVSTCSVPDTGNTHSCREAAEIREENKVLHASIANLSQQVMEIKSLLNNHYINLITGSTAERIDNTIRRQTSSPKPDVARELREVSCETSMVDENYYEYAQVTEKESSSAQKEIERQSNVPGFIGKEFEQDVTGRVKKAILTKEEVECLSSSDFLSEIQTQCVGDDHDRVQGTISPVYEKIDRNITFALSEKVNNEVEFDEAAESDEMLVQMSDICDDTTIRDDEESSDLFISDKPFELTMSESSEIPVVNTFMDCEVPISEAYQSSEIPVVNSSIGHSKSELRLVERFLFDNPTLSADDRLEEKNSEAVRALSNNCDINLKFDEACNKNHDEKKPKRSKLTKLEKIRKRLQPKNKIKVEKEPKKPTKKLRAKCASYRPPNISENTELNDKAVYAKALAVVTELRAKQKTNTEKSFITRACRVRTKSEHSDKLSELGVPKRIPPPQVLKFRQSPRLHRTENKAVPKLTNGEKCDQFQCETNSINTRSKSKSADNTPTRKSRKSSLSVDMQTNNLNDNNSSQCMVRQNETEIISLSAAEKLPEKRNNLKRLTRKTRKSSLSVYMHTNSLNDNNSSSQLRVPQNDAEILSHGAAEKSQERRNNLKRPCVEAPELVPKRKLRSFTEKPQVPQDLPSASQLEPDNFIPEEKQKSPVMNNESKDFSLPCKDYSDMDMFTETIETVTEHNTTSISNNGINHPKDSILCKMIEKHGISKNKKFFHNKIPANNTNSVCNTLEQSLATIKELPTRQVKAEMDRLVNDMKGLPHREFVSGITKFLKEPARKTELFNKITSPPAPPMTKSEQILLYLISQTRMSWKSVDIVDEIMANIEFSLFRLGQAPEFDVIESLSHFYAVLCRFSKAKNRLRLFILDAMYCLAYKAIPLIKTCIDVWMHVLPLAHMGMAKSPLVICVVYLLHYYKCEDNFKRVQEIRFLLKKRYSYEMTEWNETRMLDLLENAILELRENPAEKKMLRTALIILAKRQGTKWCQNNLLKRLLLPIIDKEDQSERVKDFCVSMLGPLMKPYPNDMKVHCEIVLNQLFDMLEHNSSQRMQEAILISLLYIQRHDPYRVTQALLSWRPQRKISQQLEDMLREFVRDKPIKVWTRLLAKYAMG